MNRTSRITATTLAALLAAAPAAAFAQSSTTGAPGSGTSTSEPGMTTGAPTANQPTAAQPGGMTADTGQGQQLSQSTLESVQEQLQQQGFYKSAKVDGRWGPQTRRAVQSFQQAKGMPATGQLDEQTLGSLGVNKQGG